MGKLLVVKVEEYNCIVLRVFRFLELPKSNSSENCSVWGSSLIPIKTILSLLLLFLGVSWCDWYQSFNLGALWVLRMEKEKDCHGRRS